MSCSSYKNNILFFTAFVILIVLGCQQDDETTRLLKEVESINYSNVESPVVDKIKGLGEDVKEDPGSAEHWGKLAMNLYIHGFKPASVPLFKKAAALDENDFRWPYFCALVLNELGSDETVSWFEKSRKLNDLI